MIPPERKDNLNDKARARLSGVLRAGRRLQVVVEWYDSGGKLVKRLNTAGLEGYGYQALVDDGGATIAGVNGTKRRPFRVTSWPIEVIGAAPARVVERVREESGPYVVRCRW